MNDKKELEEGLKSVIKALLASFDSKDKKSTELMAFYILLLKNSSFEYENEIRLLVPGTPLNEQPCFTKYRINKQGMLTPFVDEYFPKEALKEIWIGPTRNIDLTIETLQEFLVSKGFNHTKIFKSKIPYRG